MSEDTRITPRRQRTRERLIDAAIPLFATKGVAASSIEELCEAAGMTRGAFYSNFSSRDELVLAVCDFAIRREVEWVNRLAEGGLTATFDRIADSADRATAIQAAVEQYFGQRPDTVDWVLAEQEIELYAMRVPELRSKYEELVQAHFEQFALVIGTLLTRLGGSATIPLDELVSMLATVTRAAALRAIPQHSGTGRLAVDPTATARILSAFTEF